jgi:hypothetical protein
MGPSRDLNLPGSTLSSSCALWYTICSRCAPWTHARRPATHPQQGHLPPGLETREHLARRQRFAQGCSDTFLALTNKSGNIKLADFGLSTIFRNGTRERFLDTRCGSKAYVAPEVSTRRSQRVSSRDTLRAQIFHGLRYRGVPVDIWSCGVCILVIFTGGAHLLTHSFSMRP